MEDHKVSLCIEKGHNWSGSNDLSSPDLISSVSGLRWFVTLMYKLCHA
jgi:hypothetical protein